jgi:hypothetical protein
MGLKYPDIIKKSNDITALVLHNPVNVFIKLLVPACKLHPWNLHLSSPVYLKHLSDNAC